jgi:uncharacterized protein YcbK (DUF882 family)
MQKKIKYIIVAFVIYIIMKTKKVIPDQLTKNFHIREFASKDGANTPDELRSNLLELAQNLQKIRDVIDEPIYINSGYRTKDHNAKVGGVSNSYHTKGMAVDIRANGLDSKQLYTIIAQMMDKGSIKKGGLGLYNSFVHYDIQGKKITWDKR